MVSDREVRKLVTVLFCDLVDSTAASEGRDPEAVRRDQQRYFDRSRAAVERHGGTVEKFIGDAVMAVFGIPRAHEDDALRALRAALEVREGLVDLGIQGRIGVCTGEVVAGALTGDALVTGDPVNVASRFEHAATPGEIWMDAETAKLAGASAVVEFVGDLDLKGKPEPVPAYRLIEVRGPGSAPPVVPSGLVGRADELTVLADAFDRSVADRSAVLATVLGAAGIGKSRLASALVASIDGTATVWTGRCLSYGDGITYGPLREIFRQADAVDDLDRALALGSQAETAVAVRAYLERRARTQPVVLVLEDVHWAEPTLLDLIDGVARLSRDAPIFIVCLARPELLEGRPDWMLDLHGATTVSLEGLSADDSVRLLDDRAEGALDEAVRRRIVEIAEGNPLFLEELLAVAAAHGSTETGMPTSIQAVLAARIDGLEPGEQRVAELASIQGKEFSREGLAALGAAADADQLGAHLASLEAKHLVVPVAGAGPDLAAFRHQLIRDATYARISKADRAQLHERAAAWLGSAPSSEATDRDEIIGYHLERSCALSRDLDPGDATIPARAERAADHLARAGHRAFARSDMPAAANLLGRAVALFEVGSQVRVEALSDLGLALTESGALDAADEALTMAVEEAHQLGDAPLEARADILRLQLRLMTDPESAPQIRQEGERLVAAFDGTGADRTLAKAWELVGTADLYACRYGSLEHAMTTSLDFARRAGDPQQAAIAIKWLAVAIVGGPTPVAEGMARLDEIHQGVAAGSEAEAGLLVQLAVLHAMIGRIDDARRSMARGRAILGDLGMAVIQAAFAMEQTTMERYAGDLALAEPELRAACETLLRIGDLDFYSTATGYLAETLCELGRHEEADVWTRRSEDAAYSGILPSQIAWRAARARVVAHRGEHASARRLSDEALALAETTDDPAFIAHTLVERADVLHFAGDDDGARACLFRAVELYEAKGATAPAARTAARLAALAPAG